VLNDGQSGHSTLPNKTFEDETFEFKHDPYVLTSPNFGPNSNTSQFAITLTTCPWLDETNVVFGKVKEGFEVVKVLVDLYGTHSGKPKGKIIISDCGILNEEEAAKIKTVIRQQQ